MFKPFFIHINPYQPGKLSSRMTRGATIQVCSAEDGDVQVAVAFCSPKDQFVKAIGREQAVKAPAYLAHIAAEDLPAFACGVLQRCYGGDYPEDYLLKQEYYAEYVQLVFGYLLKKVL